MVLHMVSDFESDNICQSATFPASPSALSLNKHDNSCKSKHGEVDVVRSDDVTVFMEFMQIIGSKSDIAFCKSSLAPKLLYSPK